MLPLCEGAATYWSNPPNFGRWRNRSLHSGRNPLVLKAVSVDRAVRWCLLAENLRGEMRGRKIERGVMTTLALASLVWTGVWAVGIWRTPGFAPIVERVGSELIAAHEEALVRAATPERLADRLSARLEEEPRDWVVIEALVDLAEAQGGTLPEELLARQEALYAQDNGWIATGTACAACAIDVANCDLSASLICGVVVNLTILGDIATLAREGGRYVAGEPVDTFDVGIAFVGLASTGLAVPSGGTSLVVKGGAVVLKIAHRTGRLAPEVVAVVRTAARNGIDWARMPTVRGTDDLAALARPSVIRPAIDLAHDLGRLQGQVGMRQALHLVGGLDTPTDIARVSRASDVLGPRTLGAFEMLGKSRFLRVGVSIADEVLAVLAGVMGLIASGAWLLAPLAVRVGQPVLRLALRKIGR
jgi:hypothetical protein